MKEEHILDIILTILLLLGIAVQRTGGNDILGLDIPTEPTLDYNTVCKTFPDLTPRQYGMCSRYPDVTAAAIQGLQLAVHECQHQFKNHRWNCSALEKKNKNPHKSALLLRGYKESAFAYAISAAGILTQVSRACSLGKLNSCGCTRNFDQSTQAWKWSGCKENVQFADRYARKFLSSKDIYRDLPSHINTHNNRVGRLVVRQNTKEICKCHGMSGSCELRTCWKSAAHFREIGDILKNKYRHATKVLNTNSASIKLKPVKKKKKHPHKTNLVFYEKSPNYCEPDGGYEIQGTAGRYCNKTSDGIDNCDTLCCGRGYNTLKLTRVERCNCQFHWCCYVECDSCMLSEWVTVCK